MAKTDTLNIRIEPELKKEVEKTLNDLGMKIYMFRLSLYHIIKT